MENESVEHDARMEAIKGSTGRKIIQVTGTSGEDETVYALCNDGTLWSTYPVYQKGWKEWEKMPDIPQTPPEPEPDLIDAIEKSGVKVRFWACTDCVGSCVSWSGDVAKCESCGKTSAPPETEKT